MLKYADTKIVFSEIPDEITLAINITNCPIHCPECHSKYLWKDFGTDLTSDELNKLVKNNSGITCVGFMGGDNRESELYKLIYFLKKNYPYKIAWYSGKDYLSESIDYSLFDYIKIGRYDPNYGPLNNPNTNQKLYQIDKFKYNIIGFKDITSKFWNNV